MGEVVGEVLILWLDHQGSHKQLLEFIIQVFKKNSLSFDNKHVVVIANVCIVFIYLFFPFIKSVSTENLSINGCCCEQKFGGPCNPIYGSF